MSLTALCLQQAVNDLLAVLAVTTIADMHPVGALGVVLPDELVELAVLLDILKPRLTLLDYGLIRKGLRYQFALGCC